MLQKYLYRATRLDEDVSNNIIAKNPMANYSLVEFVRNGSKLKSQYVAATASWAVALQNLGIFDDVRGGNGVAILDVQKLQDYGCTIIWTCQHLDMLNDDTHKPYYSQRAKNQALASMEVDLIPDVNGIPRDCYRFYSWGEVNAAYKAAYAELGYAAGKYRLLDKIYDLLLEMQED